MREIEKLKVRKKKFFDDRRHRHRRRSILSYGRIKDWEMGSEKGTGNEEGNREWDRRMRTRERIWAREEDGYGD